MTQPASGNPHLVARKPRDRGAAASVVNHDRRIKRVEGSSGYLGSGATIDQVVIQTAPSPYNYYPGIVYDSSGLRAYNSGGIVTMMVNAADGSVTVFGTGVITGGTIQTGTAAPRVVLDSSGLHAYDRFGTVSVAIGSDGSFNLSTANAVITASTQGVTISSAATIVPGARVSMDPTGIKGYNASGQQEFFLDATSGIIQATGVIQATPGSTVPWQTTDFFVGGGNLVINSSAEDPTSVMQMVYLNNGTGVTGGSFTLRYASNTATAAIAFNATASSVQSRLNAAGVLPVGVSATCTGGPLGTTPVVIQLIGFSTPAPLVLTVSSSTLVGGSAIVGAIPQGWAYDNNALDFIQYPQAFHGGNVFRSTARGAGQTPYLYQQLGPFGWTPGTTRYTLSAYFRPTTVARSAAVYITWLDATFGIVREGSDVTYVNTVVGQWTRAVLTSTVPPAPTRQQIAITGSPTGGTFTLTYNGQTTAAIAYNATAAQVLSAIQGLSNVGASGAFVATGGPLPGTAINVSFISPPAAAPATMTYANHLTGGTNPAVAVQNMPAFYAELVLEPGQSASPGEVYYTDAIQFECGDVPTAYGPRPDEIVANTVTANMITVASLSSIAANIGTITAGTLNAVNINSAVITGSIVQTSVAHPKTELNSTGLITTDSSGNPITTINPNAGLSLTAGLNAQNIITWSLNNINGTPFGNITVWQLGTGLYNPVMTLTAGQPNNNLQLVIAYSSTVGAGGSGIAVQGTDVFIPYTTIINDEGHSAFMQTSIASGCTAGFWGRNVVQITVTGGAEQTVTFSDGIWDLVDYAWTVFGMLYGNGADYVQWDVSASSYNAITLNFYNPSIYTWSFNFYFEILYRSLNAI